MGQKAADCLGIELRSVKMDPFPFWQDTRDQQKLEQSIFDVPMKLLTKALQHAPHGIVERLEIVQVAFERLADDPVVAFSTSKNPLLSTKLITLKWKW